MNAALKFVSSKLKAIKKRLRSKSLIDVIRDSYNKKKTRLKAEEAKQRAFEPNSLRILTSGITFTSMVLIFSFIPLFPQPLPIIIAALVAVGTFLKPQYAMTAGGLIIGLSMLFHLSEMNFIAWLGPPIVRILTIVVLMYFFLALPWRFHTCEDAIAIDLGVLAATLMLFNQTYIFAVPLLLTGAVLFKKTQGALALSFYALIFAPLQVLQFSQVIPTIQRAEWWLDPRGVPSMYSPLTGVFQVMQKSMTQFRLFDSSNFVGAISYQVTVDPGRMAWNVQAALSQYLDSFPGVVMFLVIAFCLVLAAATIGQLIIKNSYSMKAEYILPALMAAGATAVFFILLVGLQRQLAFSIQLNTSQMIIATLSTIAFALPASFLNYMPKKKAAIEMRSKLVMAKTQKLTTKLQVFEALLNKTKSTIPVDVNSPEGKMRIIKDKLNDITAKTAAKAYDPYELDQKLAEMEKNLSTQIGDLTLELDALLQAYQLLVNYEYTTWTGKLKAIGFNIGAPAKIDFQKDVPMEARIDTVAQVIAAGRVLADQVSRDVEQSYAFIRSLYDPSLPEQSRTITFVKQQLEQKVAPWTAVDALFASLTTWKSQYGAEFSKSTEQLLSNLNFIGGLTVQGDKLETILGENYAKITDLTKKAQDLRLSVEGKQFSVTNLSILGNAIETSLNVSRDVLSILHGELESKEESVDNLLPVGDRFWEKNVSLREESASALEELFKQQALGKKLQIMPHALTYIGACVETIAVYKEKEELLLNYPQAKTAIEELLRQKKRIFAQELPFEPKYAEKYLKLFYAESPNELVFEEATISILKKSKT